MGDAIMGGAIYWVTCMGMASQWWPGTKRNSIKHLVLIIIIHAFFTVPVSHEAQELPPTTQELKLYVSGEFQSEVCVSPDLSSPAPYWEFNGTLLNNNEINADYGAIVGRNSSREGYQQSILTIPSVDLRLNATVISCLVNETVIQQYHVTVGE